VVVRKKLTVLLMALVLALMPASPALADPGVDHFNHGTKADDGLDKNKGGGQEKAKHEHPPHAGGDQHGGGSG
jgi:hypothetical protein